MNSYLKSLITQYDQKRLKALRLAEKKKYDIYNKYPDLERIDNNISSLSVKNIQLILSSRNKEQIDKLNSRITKLRKERVAFLKKYNLSDGDFLPKFECKKCNDTGYVYSSEGNVLCTCIKQKLYDIEYNSSNIYDLKNHNFSSFDLSLYSDKPSAQKYNSAVSPRENMVAIERACKTFINNFDDPNEPNLLFCGNTGLGKTFLSSCIANELVKRGKTVLYQTAPIMLDKIIDYKFNKTSSDITKSIYTADLLIIDDLGTEARNSLKLTELFNIINSRLLNQNNQITKTIISTNLSLQEMYDTYEERIVSRIIGNYNACYFYGEDIRIQKKLASV